MFFTDQIVVCKLAALSSILSPVQIQCNIYAMWRHYVLQLIYVHNPTKLLLSLLFHLNQCKQRLNYFTDRLFVFVGNLFARLCERLQTASIGYICVLFWHQEMKHTKYPVTNYFGETGPFVCNFHTYCSYGYFGYYC